MLSIDALRMVTDSQFESMGIAIGHVAKLRSLLSGTTLGTDGITFVVLFVIMNCSGNF